MTTDKISFSSTENDLVFKRIKKGGEDRVSVFVNGNFVVDLVGNDIPTVQTFFSFIPKMKENDREKATV